MSDRTLFDDTRAIEGLPVRLVIAFVVGIASLSVMLNMVSGLGGLAVTELDAHPSPDVVRPGPQTVTITAVDAGGDPVGGAVVIVENGTATIDGPVTERTGANGTATVHLDPSLAPSQSDGTLEITIKPPAGGGYADRRANTEILVLREANAND